MTRIAAALVLIAGTLFPQDPAALIEQLRSDDLAVRERAFADLENLGAAAEEALKKAAKDPDAGVAHAVGKLLRIVELERTLSPALKKEFPGIARRLGRGMPEEWTRIYLDVASAAPDKAGVVAYASLTRADLEPLAANALRYAPKPDDRKFVASRVAEWQHRSALPCLLEMLRDADREIRRTARNALQTLVGRGIVELYMAELASKPTLLVESLDATYFPLQAYDAILPIVHHADDDTRENAVDILEELGVADAVAEVPAMFRMESVEARLQGLELLAALGDAESAAIAIPLLADKNDRVRIRAFKYLRGKVPIPVETLCRLIEDPDTDVRGDVLRQLKPEDGPAVFPSVRKCLDSESTRLTRYALEAMARLKDPETVDRALKILREGKVAGRIDAMGVLGSVAPERAAETIRPLLESETEPPGIREAAFETLERIDALPAPEDLAALARGAHGNLAWKAAIHLVRKKPEVLRGEWQRLLADPDMPRLSIPDLLKIEPREVLIPLFLQRFKDFDSRRWLVAQALIELKADPAPVREMVDSDDLSLRVEAIALLGSLGSGPGDADFLPLLEDPELKVREAALRVLQARGFNSWEPVARLSTSANEREDVAAARALFRHARTEMIPTLERLMSHWNRDIAEPAIVAQVVLRSPTVGGKLVEWLAGSDPQRVELARNVLAIVDSTEARAALPSLLARRDNKLRDFGSELVEALNAREHLRLMLPYLEEYENGYQAARNIAHLQGRELVPDLVALLKRPEAETRENAMYALTGLAAPESAPAIRAVLADPEPSMRLMAVVALGYVRDREAVPALVELLRHRSSLFRSASARALARIGDPSAGPALVPLLQDRVLTVRQEAAFAVGQLRTTEAVPMLLDLVRDPSTFARAIAALTRIATPEAVAGTVKLLELDNVDYRVIQAVGAMGAKDAMPRLRVLAEKSSWYAAEALARLGDDAPLAKLLESKDESVRFTAAGPFCRLGDRRGVDAILRRTPASRSLHLLNAVRNPAGWKALEARKFQVYFQGVRRNLLRIMGSDGGPPFRIEGVESFDTRAWAASRLEISHDAETGVDLLDEFLNREGNVLCAKSVQPIPPWTFIIEDDVIRILPVDAALEFWRLWWAAESSKDKK